MRGRGALPGLVLVLVAGCSAVFEPPERGYSVTYTVELPAPTYRGSLDVEYAEGLLAERHSVRVETPPPTKAWSIDVWVEGVAFLQAEVPADVVEAFREDFPLAGFPIRCRVAVNGIELGDEQHDNLCYTTAYLPGDRNDLGEPVERFPARPHPPELWPETTEPAAPTTTAPAGPRPEECRYATDAEIAGIVQRVAYTLYLSGVTTSYPYSCLYRFAAAPVPGATSGLGPFAGVTVVRYPTPLDGVQGEPVPGLSGARRVTDQEVSGNVGGRGLTVMVDLGSTSADIAVSAEVYELVRSRV